MPTRWKSSNVLLRVFAVPGHNDLTNLQYQTPGDPSQDVVLQMALDDLDEYDGPYAAGDVSVERRDCAHSSTGWSWVWLVCLLGFRRPHAHMR